MLTLSHLLIDYLPAPTGVTGTAELGWALESDRRNVRQEAYQLRLQKGGVTVWDSGIVPDSRSAHVPLSYPWESITRYTVAVRAWAAGEVSGWLEGSLVTGFQDVCREWRGEFVSAELEADKDQSNGTLLRREFTLRKPLREAWLVCSAHGLYQCTLNGRRVSEEELAPGWTSYHKRLLYQTYDVTELLRPGENALGVHLGAGWYKGMMGYKHTRNNYGSRTAFGGQLILRYTDGTEEAIYSSKDWKGSKSPVLFAEIYGGERYDARLEQPGWDCPGFDDTGWFQTERVEQPLGALFPSVGSPVRRQESFTPKLFTTPGGDLVADFGQNLAGWCEVTMEHTRAGDTAELEFFEVLDKDGNVYTENLRGIHQIVRYTCRSGEQEVYHPHFTFQGFRYAKICSFPGEVKPDSLRAWALHSDMEPTGVFRCSNPLLNRLQHNILWGMKGNFLDIPTDCPQRDERLGWTGDVQAFCRTSCYLMNTDTFYRKWLADLAADQTPEGAVPHVVPDILTGHMEGDWLLNDAIQGGASGWADVAIILPWTLYQIYGDKEILRRQMPSMLAWVDFMRAHSEGCLFTFGAQFGDWLALDAEPGSYKGATPDEYTSAAYYCCAVGLVGKMLCVLGREEEAERYHAEAEALCADFCARFLKADGSLTVQTQTAHVLALAFGLAPEESRPALTARLKALLAENGGHLTTGFLGTPFLLRALSENGGLDEAYDLLLKEDFPSWLYQVKLGATTVWEHWDGIRPDGSMWSPAMNSFNHYAYGSVGEWLYRTAAGLEPDEDHPGFDRFTLRPQIGGGLNWAELDFQSVHGKIFSRWERDGQWVTLRVVIPANTDAEIVLTQAEEIMDGDGLDFAPDGEGFHAAAGSGRYMVQYRLHESGTCGRRH